MIQPWQIDVDNRVRTQTYFGFATSNCLAWGFLSKIVKIRAISHNIAKASTYPSAECSHPLGTFRSYHKLIKIRLQIFTQCCELARLQIKRQSQRNAHARGSAAREDDCRTSSCATRQIRRCWALLAKPNPSGGTSVWSISGLVCVYILASLSLKCDGLTT